MRDDELRVALLAFFNEQRSSSEEISDSIASARESLSDQQKIDEALHCYALFLKNFNRSATRLIAQLADGGSTDAEEPESNEPAIMAGPAEPEPLEVVVTPAEQELVASYNNENSIVWRRNFGPVGFGAENMSEIWKTGGQPRFAKKEGGIYNLICRNGISYVVPERGRVLMQSDINSEGLAHLFDISGYDLETGPAVALIRPAIVAEAGGRWIVAHKGQIGSKA